METKAKIIVIEVIENDNGDEMLSVGEFNNTPYSAPVDRSGIYNMSVAYWIKNEFPVWSETASIVVYPKGDTYGQYGLKLS